MKKTNEEMLYIELIHFTRRARRYLHGDGPRPDGPPHCGPGFPPGEGFRGPHPAPDQPFAAPDRPDGSLCAAYPAPDKPFAVPDRPDRSLCAAHPAPDQPFAAPDRPDGPPPGFPPEFRGGRPRHPHGHRSPVLSRERILIVLLDNETAQANAHAVSESVRANAKPETARANAHAEPETARANAPAEPETAQANAIAAPENLQGAADAGRTSQIPAAGLRQKQLTEAMRINASSMSEFIGRLEDDGYVERNVDPSDKRATLITLTEKGRARACELQDERKEKMNDLFSPLTEEEKKELLRLLSKLQHRKEE